MSELTVGYGQVVMAMFTGRQPMSRRKQGCVTRDASLYRLLR
jgi:hypothetical protein